MKTVCIETLLTLGVMVLSFGVLTALALFCKAESATWK